MSNLKTLLVVVACLATAPLTAADQQGSTPAEAKILRVGGDYTVEAIDKVEERSFKIVFKADKPSGHFDVLNLESDHVHVAVKVGQKVRLSAEILSEHGPVAEVAQVVIFFESHVGRVPVWMLSTKSPHRDLRASKYLEMHSPVTDFMVM